MPGEEETTPETATPNAAQPAPAAAPAAEAPSGKPLSFAERMKAQGWNPDDDPAEGEDEEGDEEESSEPDAAAEPATAEPEPPRPKVVDAKPEQAAKLEQLRSLATELGLEVDGKHVVAQERVRFREHKRTELAAIEQHKQRTMAEIGQVIQATRAEIDFGKKTKELIDNGDFDGLAAHLGKKDWNDLNTTALTAASDPQWKANLELRRDHERLRQERELEKRQLQEAQQRQQEAVAHQRWHSDLEVQMKASGHKLLEAFADDSPMRDAIIGIQRHYYHQSGGREAPLSPAQALRVKMPGTNVTLEQQMSTLYDRLGKALGKTPEPAPTAAPPVAAPEPAKPAPAAEPAKKNGKRPAPKTGVIDPEARAVPSKRDKWTKEEWRAHFRKNMANAIASEE